MIEGREGVPGTPELRVPTLRVAEAPVRWDLPDGAPSRPGQSAARRSAVCRSAARGPERRFAVVLRLAETRVAVDARFTKAVRTIDAITPVPRTPPYVHGVTSVRGRILPVIDLGGPLGLPRADGPPWTGLLVEVANLTVVLVVDEVADRVELPPDDPPNVDLLDLERLLRDLRPTPRARSPIR